MKATRAMVVFTVTYAMAVLFYLYCGGEMTLSEFGLRTLGNYFLFWVVALPIVEGLREDTSHRDTSSGDQHNPEDEEVWKTIIAPLLVLQLSIFFLLGTCGVWYLVVEAICLLVGK